MKSLAFTVLLVSLFLKNAHAQGFFAPGYAVTITNDTVRGEIRELSNQRIQFRSAAGEPVRDYNPGQLSAYVIDDVLRISGRITDQGHDTTLFMREVVAGYVKLYQLLELNSRLTHVLGMPDQRLLPLRGSLALSVLTQNLTECTTPRFRNLLNPASFFNSNGYYERLVQSYNECVKPAIAQKKRKRSGYEAGVLAGGAANIWKYGTDIPSDPYWNLNGVYSTYYTVAAGFFYTLAPARKFSLTVETLFSQYKGQRTVIVDVDDLQSFPGETTRIYQFDEQYLTIPIMVRYMVVRKPVQVYAKLGVSINPVLSLRASYTFPTGYGASLDTNPKANIGYLIGAGIGIPLTPTRTIYAELRFAPHLVTYGVTRIADSRSLQLTVLVPIISR